MTNDRQKSGTSTFPPKHESSDDTSKQENSSEHESLLQSFSDQQTTNLNDIRLDHAKNFLSPQK